MNSRAPREFDVVIIGAGPAGAFAAALLRQQSLDVLVLEKQHFPRFSIGESLLPHCMDFLEQGGMLDAVNAAGFRYKNGAAFHYCGRYTSFDFSNKGCQGWNSAFQVERARFDHLLAEQSRAQGAEIRYGHEIVAFRNVSDVVVLDVISDAGESYSVGAGYVLDASGFGRVLPRLLDLETRSEFSSRSSVFSHVTDHIDDLRYDRDKVLVDIHPEHRDIWFWLIPFNQGRASIGVILPTEMLESTSGEDLDLLHELVSGTEFLSELLSRAEYDTPVRRITSYACNVRQLHGERYALLGNAAEFLDPIFSSGVTIALKSASLAVPLLVRELAGDSPDWDVEYSRPLRVGVDTFRKFVTAWYDGRLQDIFFASDKAEEATRTICSILAGYAWDTDNPYVRKPSRLDTLAQLCRAE